MTSTQDAVVSTRLDPNLLSQLDSLSEAMHITHSAALRLLVISGLESPKIKELQEVFAGRRVR